MSENAMDSETIGKPTPDTAKPKGARKARHWRPRTFTTLQNWPIASKRSRPNLPRRGTTRLRRYAIMNAPTQRALADNFSK
jgi:hypothetical protein